VSITATSTPAPVYPRAHAACAPTIWVTEDIDPRSAGSYPNGQDWPTAAALSGEVLVDVAEDPEGFFDAA
jgi:hypothetical protein